MKHFLLAATAIVLCSGCSVMHPRISGSGVRQSEYRQVAPFEEIKLAGFGTVNVSIGNVQSVWVTTDDNLLANVETKVDNGRLKIKPRGRIRPQTGLTVDVTVPSLTAARVSGAGDIHVNNMVGDHLDLSISGAGSLTAAGQVNHISTSISGAGSADLKDLHAASAEVKISGAGNAEVFATESVEARVSGAGNVVCYGNPTHVDKHVSGIGNVTKQDDIHPTTMTIGDIGRPEAVDLPTPVSFYGAVDSSKNALRMVTPTSGTCPCGAH